MKTILRRFSRFSRIALCGMAIWQGQQNVFALLVGDRIQASATLNVRPSPAGTPVSGTQASGSQGSVVAGPTNAVLSGTTYTWYNINFDSGVDGWVADINLTLVASLQQPSGISATASSGSIQVSWTDNATGESNYRVERKVGAGSFSSYASIAANSSGYNDTSVTPGTLYTYRVFAYLGSYASVYSSEASATAAADLQQPTGISATASPGSIQVNWTDNSTGESNYRVERKVGAGSFSTYATIAANSTGYNDTSVTPGTLYTYRVFAYSGIYASVYSAEASATAEANLQQPTGISATASPGSIQVNWTDNSTGEANYKIERKIGAGSFSTYATLAANSTGYNDTSVTPGTLYTYRVFAYSGIFASVYSAEASATAVSASAQGLSLSPLSLAFSSSARSVVDLQVFYTPAAKNEAGGDANLCNEIAAAVKQSNDAYVNSQVNHRLRLLNIETVDYTEATVPAGGIGTDIDRLMKKTDGHLDGVHILRDQKGADVVVLVEAAGVDQGGISKAMTNVSHSFESNALCIVRRPEMNGFFALPHEVGHIMGCAHDRGQPDTGAYSYSYGYVFQSGGNTYGDIMSYPPVGATRIPYFSNPNVLYGGVPTGISESQPTTSANTALTMNNTASTVAGFRSAVLSASVVTISNSSASQITVSSISAETPAPWLSISPQGSFSVNANSAQNVTVQVDYGLAPSGYSNVRLLVVTNGVSIPGGIAVIVDNDTPPPTRVISLSGNLAFGNVTVGTSAQSTLTIANNGNSTLTVNSISYPSGFSGNWSGTIPQGDSHNVSVTFSPISAINYGGNNLVVNSDATSGTGSRAISGVGVSRPNLSISKQGGDLVFTWPANVSGFTLEYTTNLPATSWTSNPILPVIVGQNYTVTNPITDGNKFFRLTK